MNGGARLGASADISIDSAELANQIRRVFRLTNGDHVILFDGSGFDFTCEIIGDKSGKNILNFHIISTERSRYMPVRDVYLCAAITKKDTFEWIVEKATELGVTHIIPVLAERSEKKALNMERLNKIAVEASEQSGRGSVPEILAIMELEDAIGKVRDAGIDDGVNDDANIIAFHTEGELLAGNDLAGVAKSGIALFIGPEGGWSESEVATFHKEKIAIKCLGSQVLRAETAVIVALSKVMFPN